MSPPSDFDKIITSMEIELFKPFIDNNSDDEMDMICRILRYILQLTIYSADQVCYNFLQHIFDDHVVQILREASRVGTERDSSPRHVTHYDVLNAMMNIGIPCEQVYARDKLLNGNA